MSDSSSSFEWIQFLKLAEELNQSAMLDTSLAEAKYRTVIGRAYYAAFNFGKEYLKSRGIFISKAGGAHQEVKECFRQIDRNVARKLHNLRQIRNSADYRAHNKRIKNNKIIIIDWEKESEKAIENAKEIINAIKQLKGNLID